MYAEGLPLAVRLKALTRRRTAAVRVRSQWLETHLTNGYDPQPRARRDRCSVRSQPRTVRASETASVQLLERLGGGVPLQQAQLAQALSKGHRSLAPFGRPLPDFRGWLEGHRGFGAAPCTAR